MTRGEYCAGEVCGARLCTVAALNQLDSTCLEGFAIGYFRTQNNSGITDVSVLGGHVHLFVFETAAC